MSDDFYERVGTDTNAGQSQQRELNVGYCVERAEPTSPPKAPIAIAASGRRWAQSGDVYWPAADTCDRLEPAFYRFDAIPNLGPCLVKMKISTDNLVTLPDTAGSEVMSEFEEFWARREAFVERGFLHKRGLLLWGPPGSGKTSSLMQMAHEVVTARGGIVCQIDSPELSAICLSNIRKIEPDRPIIALIEDLDALVQRHGENQFLSLLDGETQVDRIVYVATTNYPERLDKRFVDRPSRFDTVRYIGMPSAAARRVYLSAKEPSLQSNELETWVNQSDGFSIAHLRELVILVRCFGKPLKEAIGRLEAMRVRKPSSEDSPDRAPFGIMGNSGISRRS